MDAVENWRQRFAWKLPITPVVFYNHNWYEYPDVYNADERLGYSEGDSVKVD